MFNVPYSFAKVSTDPVLYIVRHGATGDDDSYNSPENPHLNEQGKREAAEVAKWFQGRPISAIRMSGHHRTQETAAAIGNLLGLTPRVDLRIDSLDVGDVAHVGSEEEADRIVQHHVRNRNETIPGGESLNDFENRVDPAVFDGIKNYYKTGKPEAFVTHHSVQHEVSRLLNGNKDSALTHTGGVTAVMMTPGGLRAVPVYKQEIR